MKFWNYNNLFSSSIPREFQLSLGEGSTPIYSMAIAGSNGDKLNSPESELHAHPQDVSHAVWAKLEMRNPTGTHKDRSFAYWISYLYWKGVKECAIASSGNSAISAGAYCAKAGIRLHVFVPKVLAKEKVERLRASQNVSLHQDDAPRKASIQFAQKHHLLNLLASKEQPALEGYKTLAFELVEQLPHARAIFVPTSSGATLAGIYEGYRLLARQAQETGFSWDGRIAIPALYAVQTTRVHPIAEIFDTEFTGEQESQAHAIVDRVAPRRTEVADIIRTTGGGGYAISEEELKRAKESLDSAGGDSPQCGWQSALSYAGYLRWHNTQKEKAAPPEGAQLARRTSLCLFTD